MIFDYTENEIWTEVILGYRKVIEERYQYAEIQKRYKLPDSFNEERVALFKAYFLDYLYPHPVQRRALDEAFGSLDHFIKQPQKLLRILIESTRLIFKYGRHLPKILSAGIKALRSYRRGVEFENNLVKSAIRQELKPPYSKAEIYSLIKSLPRQEINEFIENTRSLFEVLYDRELVAKIIEIVEHLITMMKKHPGIYSSVEIRGLEIGYDTIKKGNQLFDLLSEEDQQKIFVVIMQIEREILDQLFSDEV